MKILIVWAMLGQGGDITTTVVGLHRGCREITPVLREAPYVGVAAKTALLFTFPFAVRRLEKKHPKWAKGLTIAAGLSGTLTTTWNLTQLPRC